MEELTGKGSALQPVYMFLYMCIILQPEIIACDLCVLILSKKNLSFDADGGDVIFTLNGYFHE